MTGVFLFEQASNSSLLIPFLVSTATTGGITGMVIAVAKLRGDTQTAAVAQAQGANEALRETLEAIERDRDYWKRRYAEEHKRANDYLVELTAYGRGGTPP